MSTFNQAYNMKQLYPTVDITTGVDVLVHPGERTLILDFLDQGNLNMLNQIRAWTHDVWAGEKWTTMCFRHQGTTSLWLFDLTFNGISTPLQLQAGMVLRFPLVSEVNRLLTARSTKSGVGKIVTL